MQFVLFMCFWMTESESKQSLFFKLRTEMFGINFVLLKHLCPLAGICSSWLQYSSQCWLLFLIRCDMKDRRTFPLATMPWWWSAVFFMSTLLSHPSYLVTPVKAWQLSMAIKRPRFIFPKGMFCYFNQIYCGGKALTHWPLWVSPSSALK